MGWVDTASAVTLRDCLGALSRCRSVTRVPVRGSVFDISAGRGDFSVLH